MTGVAPSGTLPKVGAALTGQVAVVSGAGGGIGRAVVRALAAQGARVALLDRDAAALARVHAALSGALDERSSPQQELTSCRAYICDVACREDVEATVASVGRELGPPSLLVNVAGVVSSAPAHLVSELEWERLFAVNTKGVLHLCQAVAPQMIERRRGAIVTVASNAARTPRVGLAAYAASKAAAVMYMKCLGLELARYGVRCNVVSPGTTQTAMLTALGASAQWIADAVHGVPETFRVGIPLKRVAEPEAIADVVLFLLSEAARHVTMTEVCVDGGATLGV